MLAKALPSLLPQLSHEEVLEVTQLHSLASTDYETPLGSRPFRAPHHSTSLVALIGGGHNVRPGEISLSHRGVLFLDEIPEFHRDALEALRQPLEDHIVTVARAKDTVIYPANFILIATANPALAVIMALQNPVRACRIRLHATSSVPQHRVAAARTVQAKRYAPDTKLNGTMSNKEIRAFAKSSAVAKTVLDTAAERLTISVRSYMKTIKVARTIADLAGSDTIEVPHIAEALQYRRQEQALAAL